MSIVNKLLICISNTETTLNVPRSTDKTNRRKREKFFFFFGGGGGGSAPSKTPDCVRLITVLIERATLTDFPGHLLLFIRILYFKYLSIFFLDIKH